MTELAEWVYKRFTNAVGEEFYWLSCSNCGISRDPITHIEWAVKEFNYCPFCGLRMKHTKKPRYVHTEGQE